MSQFEGKNDVFVGNVTFNTTEEQLHNIFSFVGPIKNIRILADRDSGRPKGFAFIEFHDANTALAAIRKLDGTELNGRKLRVSFSNNSNLRDVAKQIGLDTGEVFAPPVSRDFYGVTSLQLHEAWDVLEVMKTLAEDEKGEKARALLEAYPALITALQQIQRRLGLVTSESIGNSAPVVAQIPHPAANPKSDSIANLLDSVGAESYLSTSYAPPAAIPPGGGVGRPAQEVSYDGEYSRWPPVAKRPRGQY